MTTKQFLALLGSVLLFIGILFFLFSNHQERWTGFYYTNNVVGTSMEKPNYQSSIDEFSSVDDCKNWAVTVRRRLPARIDIDTGLCMQNCKRNTTSTGISCSMSSSIKFSIEE